MAFNLGRALVGVGTLGGSEAVRAILPKAPSMSPAEKAFADAQRDLATRQGAAAAAGLDAATPYGLKKGDAAVTNDQQSRLAGGAVGAYGTPRLMEGQYANQAGVQAASDQHAAAAQGVGTAGAASRAAGVGQLGQYGSDLSMVRNSANGSGPSAAQALAKSQLDSNIAAQSAMAAQARGGNIAGALRGAQQAGQGMMLQSQQQNAALRAQEQLNAQQTMMAGNAQLAGALGNQRVTDVNQAVAGAGALNQAVTNQAGQAQLGQGAIAQGAQMLGTSAGLAQNEFGQEMGIQAGIIGQQQAQQQLRNQLYGASQGVPIAAMGVNGANAQAGYQGGMQLLGAGASAGGALLAMSDKRSKTNIKDGTADAEELLRSVKPASYEYKPELQKDPNAGAGRYLSPMAQDLQKSKVGREMVAERPDGMLQVDYAKGLGAMLTGLAVTHAKAEKALAATEAKNGPTADAKKSGYENIPGTVQPGNVDLMNRPRVKNADGSVSTIRSIGIEVDGKNVLIPTVSEDGRVMSNAEAIKTYMRTGRHLGIYANQAAADRAGQLLHEQQSALQQPVKKMAAPAAPAKVGK